MFLEILVERRDRRCRFAVDAVERLRRLNPGLICCCPFGAAEKLSLCFGCGPLAWGPLRRRVLNRGINLHARVSAPRDFGFGICDFAILRFCKQVGVFSPPPL